MRCSIKEYILKEDTNTSGVTPGIHDASALGVGVGTIIHIVICVAVDMTE